MTMAIVAKPRFAGQLAALLFLVALSLLRVVLAVSVHPFAQPLRAPHLAKTLLERWDIWWENVGKQGSATMNDAHCLAPSWPACVSLTLG